MGCYIIDFFVFNLKSEALRHLEEKLTEKNKQYMGMKDCR